MGPVLFACLPCCYAARISHQDASTMMLEPLDTRTMSSITSQHQAFCYSNTEQINPLKCLLREGCCPLLFISPASITTFDTQKMQSKYFK
jgi:hypothetical protein